MRIRTLILCSSFVAAASLASAELKNSQTSKNYSGFYVLHRPNEAGGGVDITKASGDAYKFDLGCSRGAPSYNSGSIQGTIKIINGKGIYKTAEFGKCEIKFEFSKNKVKISQSGSDFDCGFGYGVYCSGTYKLESN